MSIAILYLKITTYLNRHNVDKYYIPHNTDKCYEVINNYDLICPYYRTYKGIHWCEYCNATEEDLDRKIKICDIEKKH